MKYITLFRALVLLTSVSSEMSNLSKYSIYNIETFVSKYSALDLSLYEPFLKEYYISSYFHFY